MEDLLDIISLSSVLLAGVLALAGYCVLSYLFAKTPKNLPPGPRGWGTNVQILRASINDTFHVLATEWAKKYGPLTFFYHFGHPVAIMNSTPVVRKLLVSEEYKLLLADRVPTVASKLAWYNGKDLVFSPYDAIARKKRKMLFKMLSVYGEGLQKFEQTVSDEMERLVAELDAHQGQDIELQKFLGRSVKNILYILITGNKSPDVAVTDMLESYDMTFNRLWAIDVDFVLNHLPFFAKIPGKFKKAVDDLLRNKSLAEEIMYDEQKRTRVPGNPRGIADFILEQENEAGNEWMANDPEHGKAFVTSLFQSGHLTSRGALLGIFLCFLNNPRIVKNIQEEIDRVIGNREPRLEDRSSMPYTEATITEGLRLIPSAALGGVRTILTDIIFDSMTIPKGTVFLINNWHMLHDENIWSDPWAFKPERFLDEEGRHIPADHPIRKKMLPFGCGLRSCPGEVFARSRVFMFTTCLLQKYDILPPVNDKLIPADFQARHKATNGFIRQVQPYKCRLQRRQTT